MKIVADKAIPFLHGVFEPYAEVVYKDGSAIRAVDVRDADAIVTRTRTKCTQALLEGSKVSMIASATIGLDHVDVPWCTSHGITVRNAPGCNANGVVQYFFTALYSMASRKAISLKDKTIGIIGVGHVGSRVESMAKALGFRVLLNDPPRAKAEGDDAFCTLDYLLEHSDIVTLHVPLAPDTKGMAARHFGIMDLRDFYPETDDPSRKPVKIELKDRNQEEISSLLQDIYPIFTDDKALRQAPEKFEEQRKAYNYRNEFYTD